MEPTNSSLSDAMNALANASILARARLEQQQQQQHRLRHNAGDHLTYHAGGAGDTVFAQPFSTLACPQQPSLLSRLSRLALLNAAASATTSASAPSPLPQGGYSAQPLASTPLGLQQGLGPQPSALPSPSPSLLQLQAMLGSRSGLIPSAPMGPVDHLQRDIGPCPPQPTHATLDTLPPFIIIQDEPHATTSTLPPQRAVHPIRSPDLQRHMFDARRRSGAAARASLSAVLSSPLSTSSSSCGGGGMGTSFVVPQSVSFSSSASMYSLPTPSREIPLTSSDLQSEATFPWAAPAPNNVFSPPISGAPGDFRTLSAEDFFPAALTRGSGYSHQVADLYSTGFVAKQTLPTTSAFNSTPHLTFSNPHPGELPSSSVLSRAPPRQTRPSSGATPRMAQSVAPQPASAQLLLAQLQTVVQQRMDAITETLAATAAAAAEAAAVAVPQTGEAVRGTPSTTVSETSGRSRKGSGDSQAGGAKEDPKGKAAVDPQRYKTNLCKNYERYGKCPYEDRCAYAHGLKELRSVTENASAVHSLAVLAQQLQSKMGPMPFRALGPVRHHKKRQLPHNANAQDPAATPSRLQQELEVPQPPTTTATATPGRTSSSSTSSAPEGQNEQPSM